MKSAQIQSFFWSVFSRIWTEYGEILRRDTEYLSVFSPNAGKYGPEKTLYLDTFHTVVSLLLVISTLALVKVQCMNSVAFIIYIIYVVMLLCMKI